jgi:glycosyltransferase involved in cell wall biosynthesis
MACGCFPVAVDVGIVPELVKHRENGLIVERNASAFRQAFKWCRMNLAEVRRTGETNAESILATRTWEKSNRVLGRDFLASPETERMEPPGKNYTRRPSRLKNKEIGLQ